MAEKSKKNVVEVGGGKVVEKTPKTVGDFYGELLKKPTKPRK